MYKAYFNLQEKPFKLVPNPEYLYLSRSHEIALAHLSYAMDQGDGFVVVTGEVGTGKTTLCRMFLEKLEGKTESAYIFNPSLDSAELLASICKEFGIRSQETGIKALLDILNDYLILRNKMGRKVVLLIDEAQNLTVESLEMVRMLSNLETTRQKLLQIILVGQPELSDKLDTYALRQLSQRISLGCYLAPLTLHETEKYIRHRLAIAAQRPSDLFSSSACRVIHRHASGIPRLINIAADRALLTAYSLNRKKVTRGIAQAAVKEIRHRGHKVPIASAWAKPVWGVTAFLAFLTLGIWLAHRPWLQEVWFHLFSNSPVETAEAGRDATKETSSYKIAQPPPSLPPAAMAQDTIQGVTADVPQEAASLPQPLPVTEGQADAVPSEAPVQESTLKPAVSEMSLADRVARLNPLRSREDALDVILSKWHLTSPATGQIPPVKDARSFFEISARQYGLRVYSVEKDWPLVERLNMPAVIGLTGDESRRTVFMTLVGRKGDHLVLSQGPAAGTIETDLPSLSPYLSGRVYVFWKNIFGFDSVISQGSHEAAIRALKAILEKIGYGILEAPGFDQSTQAAVLAFQQHNGIEVDGLVGPVTKMMLILKAGSYPVPRLDQGVDTVHP